MARATRAAAAVLLAAATLVAAFAPPGAPASGGVFEGRDRGCYCHSNDASPAVGFALSGLPGRYTPNMTYTIMIEVTFSDVPITANRSQGGFLLNVTAGSLSVPASMEGLVQVRGLEATHTLNGSMRRAWAVNWTAPSTPGQAVYFYAFVNTVNGNRSEGLGTDHWTTKTVQIGTADEPIVTGPPPPRPPFAIETFAMLAVAVGFGAFAFWTFRGARSEVGKDTPDNRKGGANQEKPRPK